MTIVVHGAGETGPDDLVDRIPQLHLDVILFAGYPYIRSSELTEEVEGWLRLLAQGKS
jgi:hypothetical protein